MNHKRHSSWWKGFCLNNCDFNCLGETDLPPFFQTPRRVHANHKGILAYNPKREYLGRVRKRPKSGLLPFVSFPITACIAWPIFSWLYRLPNDRGWESKQHVIKYVCTQYFFCRPCVLDLPLFWENSFFLPASSYFLWPSPVYQVHCIKTFL